MLGNGYKILPVEAKGVLCPITLGEDHPCFDSRHHIDCLYVIAFWPHKYHNICQDAVGQRVFVIHPSVPESIGMKHVLV
jgi:hypothetical protein